MLRSYKGVAPRVPPTAFVDVSAQVIGDVEMLVMGSPGKVRRGLSDQDVASIRYYSERYVAYRLDYMDGASAGAAR